MLYLAAQASAETNGTSYRESALSLLGYSTADVFQVESLLELMNEIERFAFDCVLYSQLDISYLPEDITEAEKDENMGNG